MSDISNQLRDRRDANNYARGVKVGGSPGMIKVWSAFAVREKRLLSGLFMKRPDANASSGLEETIVAVASCPLSFL